MTNEKHDNGGVIAESELLPSVTTKSLFASKVEDRHTKKARNKEAGEAGVPLFVPSSPGSSPTPAPASSPTPAPMSSPTPVPASSPTADVPIETLTPSMVPSVVPSEAPSITPSDFLVSSADRCKPNNDTNTTEIEPNSSTFGVVTAFSFEVEYAYEMETNMTDVLAVDVDFIIDGDILPGVESALGEFVLVAILPECASVIEASRTSVERGLQQQVEGLSGLTSGPADQCQLQCLSNDPAVVCRRCNGRFTAFLDDQNGDDSNYDSLQTISLSAIRNALTFGLVDPSTISPRLIGLTYIDPSSADGIERQEPIFGDTGTASINKQATRNVETESSGRGLVLGGFGAFFLAILLVAIVLRWRHWRRNMEECIESDSQRFSTVGSSVRAGLAATNSSSQKTLDRYAMPEAAATRRVSNHNHHSHREDCLNATTSEDDLRSTWHDDYDWESFRSGQVPTTWEHQPNMQFGFFFEKKDGTNRTKHVIL